MASLFELLNPAPRSKPTSPGPVDDSVEKFVSFASKIAPTDTHGSADFTSNPGFAPELFQIDGAIDDNNTITAENTSNSPEIASSMIRGDRRESVAESVFNDAEYGADQEDQKKPSRSTKRKVDRLDTRHSSKNEGQHTDRRYLCYLCNKLFTRRRSVRDHLSKIHNTKTWEPSRSLEIIVEPETGEPVEPLEAQIAKGGAAPAPTPRMTRTESRDHDIQEEPELEREAEMSPAKVEPPVTEPQDEPIEPVVSTPAPIIGKKRPLPINKKGTAKVKSSAPNKRPRLVDSESRTPIRSPSVASTQRTVPSKLKKATESPASSRAPSVERSPSPSVSESDMSVNDDGEVFCVCRKGDNHTWMIACDGGCEEWYHGGCVNIRERDGDLIDKYVCPKCTKAGFHTTWKRMCRRKGCRKPARVFDNPPSKYCSRDCGRLFFVDLLQRGDVQVQTIRHGQFVVDVERENKKRKRRLKEKKMEKKKLLADARLALDGSRPHTPAISDDEKTDYETDSSLDEDALPNRGGALRAGEVKALVTQCKSVDHWRELGRKPATPPHDPDAMELEHQIDLNDFETRRIKHIKSEQVIIAKRNALLLARETLLEHIKKRSAAIAEEVRKNNPKQKDICGYDPRLAWSEPEFVYWWKQQGGIEALETGKIGHPPGAENEEMTNGHTSDDEDANGNDMPTKGGICIKNRCQRHGGNRWHKLQVAELKFEQDLMRKFSEQWDAEENSILDRAVLRDWEL